MIYFKIKLDTDLGCAIIAIEKQTMEIIMYGKEIYNQLRTLGQTEMWSWGARSFKVFNEKNFTDIGHLGGLFFQVSGHLFKGKVMIRLAGNDTYTIDFGTLRSGVFKSKKQITDVYFDQMVDIIDDYVEYDEKFYNPKVS